MRRHSHLVVQAFRNELLWRRLEESTEGAAIQRYIILVNKNDVDAGGPRLLDLAGELLANLALKGQVVEVEEHMCEVKIKERCFSRQLSDDCTCN